jgi:lysophospholipase L1-like esterase
MLHCLRDGTSSIRRRGRRRSRPGRIGVVTALATTGVLGLATQLGSPSAATAAPAILAAAPSAAAVDSAGAGSAPAQMRLISVGRRVTASAGNPGVLVNDSYDDTSFWDVSAATQPWVAIDLGRSATRLLVQVYSVKSATVPASYRLETSGNSTDGRNGTWTTALTVTGNTVHAREHAIGFSGQRWLRLVVLGAQAAAQGQVQLNEIGVRDASRGTSDSWAFMGDSITAVTYPPGPATFAAKVHQAHQNYYPMMLDLGVRGATAADALAQYTVALARYPDVQNWVVAFGTNDAAAGGSAAKDYGTKLTQLIRGLQAAGKQVYVPRIPWTTSHPAAIPAFNAARDAAVAQTGAFDGPDFYAWFQQHPDQLSDGTHPNAAGKQVMNQMWADAVAGLYR